MATAEGTKYKREMASEDGDNVGIEFEAQRYIDVALREMNAIKYDNAIKLLQKAQELNPASQAAELLALIQSMRAESEMNMNSDSQSNISTAPNDSTETTSPPTTTPDDSSPGPYQRNKSTAGGSNVHEYSKEQIDLVKRINKCKNFYQVLNVSRIATDSEIKKSYKKLALQLHPDKNSAPGAAEAFKTVGNAVAVLTDTRKRKDYDASGADSLSPNGFHSKNHYNHYYHNQGTFENAFAGEDISAEEFFNIFFGNFPSQGTHQRRGYQYANQRQPQQNNQQPSLAFGLILILIMISMLSSFFTSDPVYSFVQSSKYPVRRETQHLAVSYYVKENFESDYQGSLGRLENSVEEDFIYTMKQNCYRERSYREAMMARARGSGSRLQFAQAQGLKMPSCDNLSKIGIRRYSLY